MELKGFDPPPEPVKVTIYHSNDMHGRLEDIARLSNFARRLRDEARAAGRTVYMWDAGDAADRRVQVCSITKGAAFMGILNAMEYQLQTMGNAISLPYGPQAMAAVAERANFPILAANCRDGEGPLTPGLQESVILDLPAGLKMGVLGLTAPWGGIYEVFGLHMPDFIPLAVDWARRMRSQGVNLLVILSHLGLEDDRRLAGSVKGLELIIGAHSHNLLPEGEEYKGVLIAQAGEYARHLGRVDLSIDPRSGRVIQRSAHTLAVPTDESQDPLVVQALAAAQAETTALMAAAVGELSAALELDYFNQCGIGDLAADVLRERLSAEAAMIASGQFQDGLPAGEVTLGDLDRACFSSANPCWTLVSGAQIREALERGLDPDIYEKRHHSFRGAPVGIPQISGMQVWYDPHGKPGQRVKRLLVRGQDLDERRTYKLAHTDAEIIPEVGYLQLDSAQTTEHEVPTIVREAIADYLQDHSPIEVVNERRWVKM
jgi:2',3'-cyclic-nucleotide 2'-phosphodiesterase (5'-nucleotidase family)